MTKALVLAGVALLDLGCTSPNPAYGQWDEGSGSGQASGSGSATSLGDGTSSGGRTSSGSAQSSGGEPGCGDGCGEHAQCVDTGQGTACMCKPGYVGDGQVCTLADAFLEPLLWQLDCLGDYDPCDAPDTCYVEEPASDHDVTRSAEAMLVGDPSVTYSVTLRLRGVIEPKGYIGGMTDGPINMGGMPNGDGWNIATLNLTDPPSERHVNAGPAAGRFCLRIDQELEVQLQGGAMVRIETRDPNNCSMINIDAPLPVGEPIVFEDLDYPPQPVEGQFLLVEAVSITPG